MTQSRVTIDVIRRYHLYPEYQIQEKVVCFVDRIQFFQLVRIPEVLRSSS